MYTLEFQRGDLTRTREVQIIYSRIILTIYKQVSQYTVIVYNSYLLSQLNKINFETQSSWKYKVTWKYRHELLGNTDNNFETLPLT